METRYYVRLKKIIDDQNLKPVYMPGDPDNIHIHTADVNRPGLPLAGFYEHFDPTRIQLIGMTEYSFLENNNPNFVRASLEDLFSRKPPVIIITRDLSPTADMLEFAEKYEVPLLKTNLSTSSFMSALISLLNVELAPRITCHGVLVEVYGEGVLLMGESGVGKSETAIELLKRGHRLIADDAVEIRRVSEKTLVGSSPENIRHFVELRGVGIINVRRIFGIGAIKSTEKIDYIINLELWDKNKEYDRMGLVSETSEILGIEVPSTRIPVKPGRNLAIIIEMAAMNHRQRKLGYNSAEELLNRLGLDEDFVNPNPDVDWSAF